MAPGAWQHIARNPPAVPEVAVRRQLLLSSFCNLSSKVFACPSNETKPTQTTAPTALHQACNPTPSLPFEGLHVARSYAPKVRGL